MHIMFDTLTMVQRLASKGFSREQSEEVIGIVRDAQSDLATKKDLDDLRKDTKKDLDDSRKDTKRDLDDLRKDTKRDLESMELRLTIKLG